MGIDRRLRIGPRLGFVLAAGLYGGWAFALFSPYAGGMSSGFKLLHALNPAVGALGVFVLSRRWLAGWTPAALAGLLYGFGPFGLSFLGFHPLTGITFAAVPWLLLPATYWQRGREPSLYRVAVRTGLCLLPFGFIIAFFWVFRQHWAGPVFLLPKQTLLSRYDLVGIVLPLSMTARPVILGVYHAGALAALMGLFVYLSVQRVMVVIPAAVGLVLAFFDPILHVNPVIWTALPMVFLSILTGLGVQTLLWAGKSDSKWVMICTVAGLLLGAVSLVLYLPERSDIYANPALFYLSMTGVLGGVWLLSRVGMRQFAIRWLIIVAVLGADCFLGSRWLIGRLI